MTGAGRRVRRGRGVALVAGAAMCLLVSGCGLSLQTLPKIGSGVSGYRIDAVFGDVLNLPSNAQVRIGAEVIGEVTGISTKNFAADVTMSIKRSVQLPQGTTAEVRFDNPLGDEYILLTPPTAAPGTTATDITAGQTLPETDTSTAPSVEDTFGALSLVLNGGGINQLQTVVHELNNTFNGNQPQIRALLGDINTAVTSLAGGRTVVDNALSAIQNLATQLNSGTNADDIANGIAAAAPAITILSQANGQLQQLLSSLQQLGSTGTAIAQQSGTYFDQAVADLVPVVQQLSAADNQISPDLGALASFEALTPKVAPGGYLQVAATVNIDLPGGASIATPGSTGYGAAAQSLSGRAAVSQILAGGLL